MRAGPAAVVRLKGALAHGCHSWSAPHPSGPTTGRCLSRPAVPGRGRGPDTREPRTRDNTGDGTRLLLRVRRAFRGVQTTPGRGPGRLRSVRGLWPFAVAAAGTADSIVATTADLRPLSEDTPGRGRPTRGSWPSWGNPLGCGPTSRLLAFPLQRYAGDSIRGDHQRAFPLAARRAGHGSPCVPAYPLHTGVDNSGDEQGGPGASARSRAAVPVAAG